MVAQAHALGATAVISRPKEAVLKVAQIEEAEAAEEDNAADPAVEMDEGVAAFASMFSDVRRGRPLKLVDAKRATSKIISRVGQDGLSTWLDEVRRYHEGTFQHCLLVTGVAVAFGLDVGFSGGDVSRLGMAATLHDIGKARIPLSILDKPGRLDPEEEEIIRRHPVIGYDLLKGVSGISPEILDGVRHHHEYLDGTGYPDGLVASQISDLVRLLTISEFSQRWSSPGHTGRQWPGRTPTRSSAAWRASWRARWSRRSAKSRWRGDRRLPTRHAEMIAIFGRFPNRGGPFHWKGTALPDRVERSRGATLPLKSLSFFASRRGIKGPPYLYWRGALGYSASVVSKKAVQSRHDESGVGVGATQNPT